MKYKISFIFFVAFLIRLISLNQSLWLDEATTARVVQQYNFLEIITKFSPNDFHPPLYYLLMKAWTGIFGYTEISLRMPSVLFSILTGYVIYLIGKQVFPTSSFGLHGARWAAAFFLFNPLIVYYSQEARMYMMATFLLTTALYFYLSLSINLRGSPASLLNRGGSISIFFFSLSISLSFLTFYGSIFLIIPMGIYLFYKKKYRNFFVFLLLFTVTILLLSSLLYRQIINARQQLQLVPNWTTVLGSANLKNLLLIPLKFSIGRVSFYPKWFYWVISGAWTSFIWFYVIKVGLKQKLLLFLVFGSLGFGILFSLFSPLLQYFRFIFLMPIISILLALENHTPINRLIGVGGFLIFSVIYLLFPTFHREDWKSLAKNLNKSEVYMILSSSDPVRYYKKDLKILDLKSITDAKSLDKEITVIPYVVDIHGIDYQKILSGKKYKLVQQSIFRGLVVEKWNNYSSM